MKITAFRNRNLTIFSIALGLLFFGFNAAEQHFTAFYQTIGKTNLAFQSLAILYAAIVIGNFIGPTFARKLGIKLAFIFGFFTYVALVFGITAKLPLLIYALSFLLGVGAGIAGIARVDFLRLITPKAHRGEFAGAMETVRKFGGFAGVAAVGLILRFLNIDQTFLLLGLVMLAGTLLLLALENIKDTNDQTTPEAKTFKFMWQITKTPKILLLVPNGVAGGFLLGLVLGTVPAVIEKNFGISWVGPITSLFHLTLALVLLTAGYLSDIKGRFPLIYSAIFASLVGVALFLASQTFISLTVVMVLLGLGGSLGGGAFAALMLDTFEEKVKEATAILGNLSIILGIVPSFLLPHYLSQNQLFYVAILLSLFGMISLRFFQNKYAVSS